MGSQLSEVVRLQMVELTALFKEAAQTRGKHPSSLLPAQRCCALGNHLILLETSFQTRRQILTVGSVRICLGCCARTLLVLLQWGALLSGDAGVLLTVKGRDTLWVFSARSRMRVFLI